MFQQALAWHQQGQLAQAQAIYQDLLKRQPRHFDAWHMLGVIAYQTKQYDKAVELIGRAIELNPKMAGFYSNRGLALKELGQLEAAVKSFEQAIALKPDYAEAYSNCGIAQKELGQARAALASYDRALALKPDFVEAYYNRGLALQELQQPQAALENFNQAISRRPHYAQAYSNRGIALKQLRQPDAALQSFNQALALKPDFAEAYYNRGVALQELQQLEAAVASFNQALALKPDYAEAYSNRGMALQELRQWDAAVASFNQALTLKPDYAEAYYNRGIALQELSQFDAAIESFNRALSLQPDYAEAYYNRGIALQELRQLDAAVASYDRAIAIQPDFAQAYWNKALTLLLSGNLAAGWDLYEWRWRNAKTELVPRNFPQPLWLGQQPLVGKTLLLHSEQGLGDTIQFCRYATLAAELGARVILEVQAPLLGLLKDLAGVSCAVAKGSPLPDFDYHCPLLSLPLAFKTHLNSIPCWPSYLSAAAPKATYWAQRLGTKTQPRVGLVWSGSGVHKNDLQRSLPLAELLPWLPAGYQYLSLQKELREIDLATLQSQAAILHFGAELEDFSDTAALCELMDLVISVDTSVAHLSGALGRPTWVLLPFNPDWRWLLDRNDSPWYPGVKLIRQAGRGDWASVCAEINGDLLRQLKQVSAHP